MRRRSMMYPLLVSVVLAGVAAAANRAPVERVIGQTLTVTLPGGVTMEMVWMEPGTFIMGTTEEQEQLLRSKRLWLDQFEIEHPAHEVTITKGFYLGKYEVAQGQWQSVMRTRPWAGWAAGGSYVVDNADHPAVYVSWDDAYALIQKLNAAEGATVWRLPTEAEWEYACRAGTTTLWSFGEDESRLKEYAWYYDNACGVGECYAHRVGTKLPNPWGVYDMHGNVWEWVQDWWYRIYTVDAQVDPVGPVSGSARVVRGGGVGFVARPVRSALRSNSSPSDRSGSVGFRLLRQAAGVGVTTVGEETEPVLPGDYRLWPNSPNPFNAQTLIRYAIPRGGRVDLTVYDLLGQRVRTLVMGEVPAGTHTALWDGRDAKGKPVGSGVYLYLLRVEQFRQVRRMVLLR